MLNGDGKLLILYVPPFVIATTEVFAPEGSLNCKPVIVELQQVVNNFAIQLDSPG